MVYYIRKIARAKWTLINDHEKNIIENYRADAIANDMRTTKDTLSFWRTESLTGAEFEPIIVINSLMSDKIRKIDLLCVPEGMIGEFSLQQEDGDTIVSQYKHLHYNIISLSIKLLINFAREVVLKIIEREEKPQEPNQMPLIQHVGEKEQLDLIITWLDDGKLAYDDLKQSQKADVDKRREKLKRQTEKAVRPSPER